jgi:uncharacterized membrane protein YkvA (DUF1232 family)
MWDLARHLLMLVAGFAVLWALIVAVLLVVRPKGIRPADAALLLPDLVRLFSRLARDRTLPRRARVPAWLLLGFLVSPIDLIPEMLPVIGALDDAILAVLVLRHISRVVGRDAVVERWPGTPERFALVGRFLGDGRTSGPGNGGAPARR